ncbi:MAG: Eco57I restriction-modification methylase domain-containing protein, partial [Desulfobaccales bacterium]
MAIDVARARQLLRNFDFKTLFIEELGWDRHQMLPLAIQVDGTTYTLQALVEKRGLVTFLCHPDPQGRIPPYATRRKLETQVAKSVHEHLIIYIDADKSTQTWQWVKREQGKPLACREHTYHRDQPGDALIQKLQALAIDLPEEEDLTIFEVAQKVRQGFYAEKVTKKFYDRFKTEHEAFLRFIQGIPDEGLQCWYASVMLNRLMFIYFIQKKGFLGGDQNYLRHKLRESQAQGRDLFYQQFLCPLFFEGFAKKPEDREPKMNRLLGQVPYLNGGIFTRHQVEELHGRTIRIADAAFDQLFAFFDAYRWHLDERPLRADNEINPDVLGYIFEKYINQKQMGAYYTKEDITEYIAKNTIIPFLFEAARQKCKIAFDHPAGPTVWDLLRANPDRYLYPAVKHGVIGEDGSIVPESELPDFVQIGMHDPKARMFDKRYNLEQAAAGDPIRLVTETWREYAARRQRCLEVREKLQNGEVRAINDLITYNLDIRQFAEDVISNCEGPELLRAFYQAIEQVTVLDPTCGSGAFLFAALNILEPLYDACLDRMQVFVDELAGSGGKRHPEKFAYFKKILARVAEHPNHRYFVLKSIIVNNLYGVDIMHEAVEICKLRLFLKLVAQVEDAAKIEPLPDIDFNIRAGNTLVGFASREDVDRALKSARTGQHRLAFGEKQDALARIDEAAEICDRAFQKFREMQTEYGMDAGQFAAAKEELRRRLGALAEELDRYLAGEYGIREGNYPKKADYEARFQQWRASHQPFHWFSEFYGIMKSGGFDVIIGNPPYVEYSKIKN